MREEDSLVFPAQRPASPEIAESPRVTTAGVPTPGPSAAAAGASPSRTIATTSDQPHERPHPAPLPLAVAHPLSAVNQSRRAARTARAWLASIHISQRPEADARSSWKR